jgi:hypothetical protein
MDFMYVDQHDIESQTTSLLNKKTFLQKVRNVFSEKNLLFDRFVVYLTLLKIYVFVPDILIMFLSFYFVKNDPSYISLPFEYTLFFLTSGIFKLFSLICYAIGFYYFEKIKKEKTLLHTFDLKFIDTINPFETISNVFFTQIAFFNVLWDIFLAVCMKCHGSEYCNSVILTHGIKTIAKSIELRRILEVHVFYSGLISNFMHIIFTPLVVYFWNKHKEKILTTACKICSCLNR